MKYIVNFGIDKFEFKDGSTAVAFAELAVNNFIPSEYNKELKPLISIENDGRNASGVSCADCEHNNDGACSLTDLLIGTTETCDKAERW